MRKFKSFQDKGWLAISYPNNSSVIRQKDKFQNGHNKKAKHPNIPKRQTFLTPSDVRVGFKG